MARPTGILLALLALLFLLPAPCLAAESSAESASHEKDPVIYVGGGAIDDFSASLLALSMDGVDYLGTVITNSDSLYRFAMQSQWRTQSFIKKKDYPVYLSSARGWNPFPMGYRADSIKVYNSTILKDYKDNDNWPPYSSGEEFLADKLARAIDENTPLTLLIPSPITPLATVLQQTPELEQGIKRVIWMGGAINVPGNLDSSILPKAICNPKAEWNAFWDPYALDWIFKNTSFPLTIFPLDVTNEAKITNDFLNKLSEQAKEFDYSKLMGGLYSLVKKEPYFEMWNTLTTAYISRPDIFEEPVDMELSVVTEGYMQGTISPVEGGRQARIVLEIKEPELFYDYVLSQMRRNAQ